MLVSLQHGVWAGGVAGIVAETLMHPFDTISTRLKVQSSAPGAAPRYHGLFGTARLMIREEGPSSLFSGVSATVLCAIPSSAIYFGVYESVKAVGLNRIAQEQVVDSDTTSALKADAVHLAAGICSELAASVVVVPFEVIKSRMQIGSTAYAGAIHGLVTVAQKEGLAGLFAGYRACLLLDCTFSGLQFLLYERLKRDIFKRAEPNRPTPQAGPAEATAREMSLLAALSAEVGPDSDLLESMEGTAEDLAAGAVAGGLAAFLSNPFDVVTARLMTQRTIQDAAAVASSNAVEGPSQLRGAAGAAGRAGHALLPGVLGAVQTYSGTLDCLAKVAKQEGVRGLWSGSLARVLSIAPLSALTFGIYEKMKAFLAEGGATAGPLA